MLTWFAANVAWPAWERYNGTTVLPKLRELQASQWLSEAELERRQWKRLPALLAEAAANCDYYRASFARHGIVPSRVCSAADLQRIPVLTKRDIQRDGAGMLHRAFDRDRLVPARTGGSTGTSLLVYADRECRDARNAAAIRSDGWAGWTPGEPRAALWGNPRQPKTLGSRIRLALRDRVICLDTMNMTDATMEAFARECRRVRPSVLFGHSHSLYVWALFLRSAGIRDIRPRGIVSTSMMLLAPERAAIEEVFGCRVTDRYGCEEVGLIACECEEHSGLHLNVDHLYVEFLRDDGTAAAPGEPARLVVTDLVNRGMPLIRYEVEDRGVRSSRRCRCGRGLPLMEGLIGRTADFLVRADGSLVAGVSLVERTLTAIPGIDRMQIVQHARDRVTARIVTAGVDLTVVERPLVAELSTALGPGVRIEIERVLRLAQQASGKYRFSICHVPYPLAAERVSA